MSTKNREDFNDDLEEFNDDSSLCSYNSVEDTREFIQNQWYIFTFEQKTAQGLERDLLSPYFSTKDEALNWLYAHVRKNKLKYVYTDNFPLYQIAIGTNEGDYIFGEPGEETNARYKEYHARHLLSEENLELLLENPLITEEMKIKIKIYLYNKKQQIMDKECCNFEEIKYESK